MLFHFSTRYTSALMIGDAFLIKSRVDDIISATCRSAADLLAFSAERPEL